MLTFDPWSEVSSILGAVRGNESSGNYTLPASANYDYPNSHAAGGYQFQPDTWANWAPQLGVDTGAYPTADAAPSWVQDAVAAYALVNNPQGAGNPNTTGLWGASSGSGYNTLSGSALAQLQALAPSDFLTAAGQGFIGAARGAELDVAQDVSGGTLAAQLSRAGGAGGILGGTTNDPYSLSPMGPNGPNWLSELTATLFGAFQRFAIIIAAIVIMGLGLYAMLHSTTIVDAAKSTTGGAT